MSFTLAFTMGPHLTILPVPGVPVDVLPTITVEIKGYGRFRYASRGGNYLEQGAENVSSKLALPDEPMFFATTDGDAMDALVEDGITEESNESALVEEDATRFSGCAALALNLRANTKVGGIGLPKLVLKV